MKVGISTASLFMRKDNEDALPFLDGLGVKNAEVFLSSFSQYGKEYGEFLAKRRGQVCVDSVHALNTQFEPQLFSRHDGVRKDAYTVLEKVLEAASALGAKYYSFHGVTRAKKAARSGENDHFPSMIEGFGRLIDFCQSRGVTLCLENVEWSTYNRPSVFKRLSAELPTLRGVLDIKQARLSGYPYETYLSEMGECLAYAHLSDIQDGGKMCLPGKGGFDFDTMIERLQDVGFDGALLIEVYEKDYAHVEELKTSYEYLSELLYKHGCLDR